jgi:hypothetical protein
MTYRGQSAKLILQDDFPETRKIAESGFGWTKSF